MKNSKRTTIKSPNLEMRYLLTAILFCLIITTSAQETKVTKSSGGSSFLEMINYGAKIGWNNSYFTTNQPYTSPRPGFFVNLFAAYNINKSMAAQIELGYSQKGGYLTTFDNQISKPYSVFGSEMRQSQLILHYIDVPIYFKYKYLLNESLKVYGMIGPSFGYLLNAGEDAYSTGIDSKVYVSFDSDANVTEDVEKLAISGEVALGLQIKILNKNYITTEFKYSYGIMPVMKDFSYINHEKIADDINNHFYSVSIGFGF